MDLNKCKQDEFDDIFYATTDSQGYENTKLAILHVLFDKNDDIDVNTDENKYLYISNNNNARKKAMLMQQDDLAHILIKYCMASFGLRKTQFEITNDQIIENQKQIEKIEINPFDMIEQVAYLATNEVYNAYEYLYMNKKILWDVVTYMLKERYISGLKEALDNFNGLIDNNEIDEETRYAFYDAYNNLDENFAEIKRNNPDYIK